VNDFSAKLGLPEETAQHMDVDHREMVRCFSRDQNRHKNVRDVLSIWFFLMAEERMQAASAVNSNDQAPNSSDDSDSSLNLKFNSKKQQNPAHREKAQTSSVMQNLSLEGSSTEKEQVHKLISEIRERYQREGRLMHDDDIILDIPLSPPPFCKYTVDSLLV